MADPRILQRRRGGPRPIVAMLALAIAGCAGAGGTASGGAARDAPAPGAPPPVLPCARDADCVVKDIGSCCGYFPACVHRDQPVDPDGVMRKCRAQGLSSTCGFAEIRGCACVDGACQPGDGAL